MNNTRFEDICLAIAAAAMLSAPLWGELLFGDGRVDRRIEHVERRHAEVVHIDHGPGNARPGVMPRMDQ